MINIKYSLPVFHFVLISIGLSSGHLGHDHEGGDHHGHSEDQTGVWAASRNISLAHLTTVDLHWIDSDPEWIRMKMSSRTVGYVAVGFCANWRGTMEGCDIVIGWVDDTNNSVSLHDYHAKGNEAPIMDVSQDYHLISGSQVDGVTTIEFKRKWDTSDDKEDANLEANSVHIIYAWHPSDPTGIDNIPAHDKNSRGHTATAVDLRNKSVHYNEHSGHAQRASTANSLSLHFGFHVLLGVFLYSVNHISWLNTLL